MNGIKWVRNGKGRDLKKSGNTQDRIIQKEKSKREKTIFGVERNKRIEEE